MTFRNLDRFAKFAWFVLACNMVVVLFGAYVRASGSGAGCGSHWPLCNGEVFPRAARLETMIEFTHRTTSGLAFLLVLVMFFWAWRVFPKGHPARLGALFSMVFIIAEALLGAGLVLFELVAENASVARALSGSFHLVNTFLLLASLSLTAWWASGGAAVQLRGHRSLTLPLGIAMLAVLIVGMSGAVTALGDTLFPSSSLAEGLQADFSPTAHFLIRLRFLHPTIAILVGAYLILISGSVNRRVEQGQSRYLARLLTVTVVVQLAAGALNVFLLAPIWLQLVHLFLSDAVWITLVLLTASLLSAPPQGAYSPQPVTPASIPGGDAVR